MDTSKEYIKMCEGAVEIQKRELSFGDLFVYASCSDVHITHKRGFNLIDKNHYVTSISKTTEYRDKEILSFVWLPRQDQLQEMVEGYSAFQLLNKFHGYIDSSCQYLYDVNIRSMEQLWLAFVMKEKYNKTWDGEEWTKK